MRLRDRLLNEPPHTPPYVLENMDDAQPRRLMATFGIEWMASRTAWVAPVWMAGVGIVIGFIVESNAAASKRLLLGLAYGALIWTSIVVHQLGGAVCAARDGR